MLRRNRGLSFLEGLSVNATAPAAEAAEPEPLVFITAMLNRAPLWSKTLASMRSLRDKRALSWILRRTFAETTGGVLRHADPMT